MTSVYTYVAECEPAPRSPSGDRQPAKTDQPSIFSWTFIRTRQSSVHTLAGIATVHLTTHGDVALSGHSTRTAVITSRIPIAAIAQLHNVAEHQDTTVSALIARIVADKLAATKSDQVGTSQ